MNQLVSIIVPAFNAEAYLERCIVSILSQVHRKLEVIVVDDCSKDGTAEILDRLADGDSRLKVVYLTENSGVHAARASGIREAKGEWIGFVDADDWIAPEMIQAMLAEARNEAADMVICGANLVSSVDDGGRPKVRFRRKKVLSENLLARFCNLEFGSGVLWNKLYKQSLIRKYGLMELDRYLDASEDYIVNIGCFADASKVVVLPSEFYSYFENAESASRSGSNARAFSRVVRAFVASLELYEGSLRRDFDLIGKLYAKQLRLAGYRVENISDLESVNAELSETVSRLAKVHPAGLYLLVHVYDRCSVNGVRQIFRTAQDLLGMIVRLPSLLWKRPN